jgi:hypothetical protein
MGISCAGVIHVHAVDACQKVSEGGTGPDRLGRDHDRQAIASYTLNPVLRTADEGILATPLKPYATS